MKEWLTASEIAAEAFREVPASERGVRAHASREGWNDHPVHARQRAGRGGGMEYNIALLPTSARIEYETRHRRVGALVPANGNLPAPAPIGAPPATDRAARERDARLAILAAYESFCRGTRLGQSSSASIFSERYKARALQIDAWIVDLVPAVSPRSLARWKAERERGQVNRLAVTRDHRKGKGLLDLAEGGQVRVYLLALLASQPHVSAAQIQRDIRHRFGDGLKVVKGGETVYEPVPPVRTIQAYVATLRERERVALTKLSNPDRYRSTMVPAGTNSYAEVTQLGTLWMIDASPVDALCVDGRWSIYACVDVGTRSLTLYVSRTPRASAVQLLARKAILAWGRPVKIKHDNGSDFVARDCKRLFASLGIEIELSPPYQPQTKGFVERAIRTFQHDCAALLPGYTGHSVAERKAIEDRKSFADRLGADTAETFAVQMTGAQLAHLADRWVETIYDHHPHSGIKGLTPAQARARSTRAIEAVDERALDLLLMPVADGGGIRTVTKLGLRIGGHHFKLQGLLPGERVLLRMDPLDAGRALAFSTEDGRFLGEATSAELSGVDPKALVRAQKEAQEQVISERLTGVKEEIKRLVSGPSMIERALEVAARDVPNLVTFPTRRVAVSTPEIEAAIAAMETGAPRVSGPVDPAIAAEQARIQALLDGMDDTPPPADPDEIEARSEASRAARAAEVAAARVAGLPENVARLPETPMERYRRAEHIRANLETAHPEDVRWLGGYEQSAEYRGHRRMHEAFGEEFLA